MDRTQLIKYLCQCIPDADKGDCQNLQESFTEICNHLNCTYEGLTENLENITKYYFSSEVTSEWKCICLSFYLLDLLNSDLENSQPEVLSVQHTKLVRNCINNIVKIGIRSNLQPNLPLYQPLSHTRDSSDIYLNYNILKCTTKGLCDFLMKPNLRAVILPDSLGAILVAVYQISFCPLKRPASDSNGEHRSAITPEMFKVLLEEKQLFLGIMSQLKTSIHPILYIRETMVIFQSKSPIWFKKAVSQTLTSIMRSKNGVENIAVTLLDRSNDDNTQTWEIIEVIAKLILSCKKFLDFRDNICKQVTGLLDKTTEDTLIYERIFILCTKKLHQEDSDMSRDIFVRPIISYLLYFTYKNQKFRDGEDLTLKLKQVIRLIHAIFVENGAGQARLPRDMLTPVLVVLFRLYVVTASSSLKSSNEDLKSILIFYLENDLDKAFCIFDGFLFEIGSHEILRLRNDILLEANNDKVILKFSNQSVTYPVTENSDCLLELLKSKNNLLVKLFGFVLNCLTNREKYFIKVSGDLLAEEEELVNEFIERNLVVYKLLAELAENKHVQQEVTKNPEDVINYIRLVLKRTIELLTHKSSETDTDAFQSVFTVLMILHSLVCNSSKPDLEKFNVLVEDLKKIAEETTNKETGDMIGDILDMLYEKKARTTRITVEEVGTELDKALFDICDPLLPTRGHGLMTLTALIEKKDKHAMERKHYILNIFQQNLKNEDSYIYLSAVGGLAALADAFPDTVLYVLCEEYADSSRKSNDEGHEVRIKLGEILVRVTKLLGDMAPKYKPLLLNTFLIGVKDEDDLIRASSLSNLGEVCRILGYKLGTIITEILACVHAVISTDKSPQSRRAAVAVLRQLFVGLENEIISFLKEDILPIYRTLKDIYHNDKDDIMRLQAQLALEELNENMKNFVFPSQQLHLEKNIIMLD